MMDAVAMNSKASPKKPAYLRRKTSEETSDKILAIIRFDMKTTARHMANVLGLSSRAVEMQLAKLKQDGRLKRVGPKKGGHWEVRGD